MKKTDDNNSQISFLVLTLCFVIGVAFIVSGGGDKLKSLLKGSVVQQNATGTIQTGGKKADSTVEINEAQEPLTGQIAGEETATPMMFPVKHEKKPELKNTGKSTVQTADVEIPVESVFEGNVAAANASASSNEGQSYEPDTDLSFGPSAESGQKEQEIPVAGESAPPPSREIARAHSQELFNTYLKAMEILE